MSDSIQGTVAAANGLKNFISAQEQSNVLLRKTLDSQANAILSLVQDAVQPPVQVPNLATSGQVGTLLHTTA